MRSVQFPWRLQPEEAPIVGDHGRANRPGRCGVAGLDRFGSRSGGEIDSRIYPLLRFGGTSVEQAAARTGGSLARCEQGDIRAVLREPRNEFVMPAGDTSPDPAVTARERRVCIQIEPARSIGTDVNRWADARSAERTAQTEIDDAGRRGEGESGGCRPHTDACVLHKP